MHSRHLFPTAFLLLLLLGSCTTRDATTPKTIVDLSPTIGEDIAIKTVGHKYLADFGYRDSTKFEHNIVEEPIYSADSYLTIFNHFGPHHDPPNHLIQNGKSTDQFPLEEFYGKAKVIDFSDKPTDKPLLKSDFENKGIEPGDVVIAFTGYTPPVNPDELPSYTYLSGKAAGYLASVPVRAFASDMPSIDSIKDSYQRMKQGVEDSKDLVPAHYALLSRGIPNIEGLVNVESIVNEEDVVFVGFPLKIKNGNGGPMRAAALVY